MERKTKQIIALVLDILIFACMVFSVLVMMLGIRFMGEDLALTSTKIEALKFFTVDSNILMGVIAAIYAVYLILVLAGKCQALPRWLHVLKLVGTVGVSLTFLTVVLFWLLSLRPRFGLCFSMPACLCISLRPY